MRTEGAIPGIGGGGAALAAGAALALMLAGSASAQVCERPDQAHVFCRFITSTPTPLHVTARGWLANAGPRRSAASGDLVLKVDGAVCRTERRRSGRVIAIVDAGCHGRPDGVSHTAEAELYNLKGAEPDGVLISIADSPHLRDLPREDSAGPPEPPRPRHGWWPRLHLPHVGR